MNYLDYKICILGLIFLIFLLNYFVKNYESFIETNTIPNTNYEKNRTKLYGSLFLDGLNDVIKNMTDPEIKYDQKRIELLRYQDILF